MGAGRKNNDAGAVGRSPRIRTINAFAIVFAAILAIVALSAINLAIETSRAAEETSNKCFSCASASEDFLEASNFLTFQATTFAITGNRDNLDLYLDEVNVSQRRNKAIETLGTLSDNGRSVLRLEQAFALSKALAERELYAMRLVCDAKQLDNLPDEVSNVRLSSEDAALDADGLLARASELMFSDEYLKAKEQIADEVAACANDIMSYLRSQQAETERQLDLSHLKLQVAILLLLALLVVVIFANIFLILWPLASYTSHIRQGELLHRQGAFELRPLVNAYNSIYEENGRRTEALRQAAERDPLTGLFNRGAYNTFLEDDVSGAALLLFDVDKFKSVNDTYGHDTGDALLKKVADLMKGSFREKDLPCRLGGDEFAVIMTDVSPGLRDVIARKIESIAQALADDSDGLPSVTISAGVAFGTSALDADEVYRNADTMLYFVKQHGRNGYRFFGDAKDAEDAEGGADV